MELVQFEELKLRAQELLKGKEYAQDVAVEGLYNRAELLIKRISDPELKDNLIRMFNEIKIRNRSFNNNHKLMALENLFDTIINYVESERLVRSGSQFFNIGDAINKHYRITGKKVENSEIDRLRILYTESAQKSAQFEAKETGFLKRVFDHPLVKWIGAVLTALLIAFIVSRLGWN